MNQEERIEGKYLIIYVKKSKNDPEFGTLADVRPGDILCFNDQGAKFLIVDKLVGSKWTRKFRTKKVIYQGHTVSKALTLKPSDIDKVLRLRDGEEHKSVESEVNENSNPQ